MGDLSDWPVSNTLLAPYAQHGIIKLEAEGIKQEVEQDIL